MTGLFERLVSLVVDWYEKKLRQFANLFLLFPELDIQYPQLQNLDVQILYVICQ